MNDPPATIPEGTSGTLGARTGPHRDNLGAECTTPRGIYLIGRGKARDEDAGDQTRSFSPRRRASKSTELRVDRAVEALNPAIVVAVDIGAVVIEILAVLIEDAVAAPTVRNLDLGHVIA